MSASDEKTHELVKQAYGSVAKRQGSCCGPAQSCCGGAPAEAIAEEQAREEGELGLSCGDPLQYAQLQAGEVVLDLGSGGGRDVFGAAQQVGPAGHVIGVDMTPEMIALARRNAARMAERKGIANVEFREGMIEALPVENASVDVIVSNCVINLSPDKPQVFREACRVLRPGGRLVVSDIVLTKPLPAELKSDTGLYAACIAGAWLKDDYLAAIRAAGFAEVSVLHERHYRSSDPHGDPVTSGAASELADVALSLTVLARKA